MGFFNINKIFGGKKEEPKKTMGELGFGREIVAPKAMTQEQRQEYQERLEQLKTDMPVEKFPKPDVAARDPSELANLPDSKVVDPAIAKFEHDTDVHHILSAQVEKNAQEKDSPHANLPQQAPPRSPEEMLEMACAADVKYETRITAEQRRMAEQTRSEIAAADIAQERDHEHDHGHGQG